MKVIFESEEDVDIFHEKLGDLLIDIGRGFPSFCIKAALYRFLFNLDIAVKEESNA